MANAKKRRLKLVEESAEKRAKRYMRPTYGPDASYGMVDLEEGEIDEDAKQSFFEKYYSHPRGTRDTETGASGHWHLAGRTAQKTHCLQFRTSVPTTFNNIVQNAST